MGMGLSCPCVQQATLTYQSALWEIRQTVLWLGKMRIIRHTQSLRDRLGYCILLQKVKDSLILHERVDSGLWSPSLKGIYMALPFVMV